MFDKRSKECSGRLSQWVGVPGAILYPQIGRRHDHPREQEHARLNSADIGASSLTLYATVIVEHPPGIRRLFKHMYEASLTIEKQIVLPQEVKECLLQSLLKKTSHGLLQKLQKTKEPNSLPLVYSGISICQYKEKSPRRMLPLELRRVDGLVLTRTPLMLIRGKRHDPIVDAETSGLASRVISRTRQNEPQTYLDVIQASDTDSILRMFMTISQHCSSAAAPAAVGGQN